MATTNTPFPISAAELKLLQTLVYRECGMHFDARRTHFLQERLQRRLRVSRAGSFYSYYNFLTSIEGKTELAQLLEELTVNETSFFRNKPQLELFQKVILEEVLRQKQARRDWHLRIWSAGCSTGQEPYTLAMVLSEYGRAHPGFCFRILATDISTAVLAKAALGIYSIDVARTVPQSLKIRYFMHGRERGSARVRVVPELRRLVEFRRVNFIDSDYGIQEKFDAIFCRNVIIYFDKPTQQSILKKIARCLLPRGWLFMGHAETLHELDLPVEPIAPALYRRINGRA